MTEQTQYGFFISGPTHEYLVFSSRQKAVDFKKRLRENRFGGVHVGNINEYDGRKLHAPVKIMSGSDDELEVIIKPYQGDEYKGLVK